VVDNSGDGSRSSTAGGSSTKLGTVDKLSEDDVKEDPAIGTGRRAATVAIELGCSETLIWLLVVQGPMNGDGLIGLWLLIQRSSNRSDVSIMSRTSISGIFAPNVLRGSGQVYGPQIVHKSRRRDFSMANSRAGGVRFSCVYPR
jgi:hypothetical protein